MQESTAGMGIEPLTSDQLHPLLRDVPMLAPLSPQDLRCFDGAELVTLEKGTPLFGEGAGQLYFWILLSGHMRIYKEADDSSSRTFLMEFFPGDTAGEVPLLLGRHEPSAYCEAVEDSRLVRVTEPGFWRMMATCSMVREEVLRNMARRFETYQVVTLHREKLISLGTLAAGLMHELNNPGAAARRAASQLRENMTRLQAISLRMTSTPLTPEQLECVNHLQERVFSLTRPVPLSSIEQSDREEELSEWLEGLGVENPWQLAPTMVGIGWEPEDIVCARETFPRQVLSDTLNYLGSLISSVQLVGTIEESITRVTDLVTAVKKYAYDDKRGHQQIDVRDSLQSTLTILGHKFRQKQLEVKTDFPHEMGTVSCAGTGLAQVWTNLLDNAIDAAPEGTSLELRMWEEAGSVCVGILDHGPGIPREHWEHIYQPFYTTKEVGVGTGLGLDIVHRIVVSSFGGDLSFTTVPGRTEFIVRLPLAGKCSVARPAAALAQGATTGA